MIVRISRWTNFTFNSRKKNNLFELHEKVTRNPVVVDHSEIKYRFRKKTPDRFFSKYVLKTRQVEDGCRSVQETLQTTKDGPGQGGRLVARTSECSNYIVRRVIFSTLGRPGVKVKRSVVFFTRPT